MLMTLALWLLPTTWIVDAAAGPGTNFTDLPTAIAAAAPGDTILVRPGVYQPMVIDAKGLTIRGAGKGVTTVMGPNMVAHTPGGLTDVISGMKIYSLSTGLAARVILTDCDVLGTDHQWAGGTALFMGAGQLFAERCTFIGGNALGPAPQPPTGTSPYGGRGAYLNGANLAAHQCQFFGGNLLAGLPGYGGAGLDVMVESHARIDSCRVMGGTGSGFVFPGDGVTLTYSSHLQIAGDASDVIAAGHPSWFAIRNNGPTGSLSTATVHGPVTLTGQLAGPVTLGAPALPKLSVTASSLPSGETDAAQPTQITLAGQTPSALFVWLTGFQPAYTPVTAPLVGDLLLNLSSAAFLVGQLDAVGQFQFGFTPLQAFGGPMSFPVSMQFAVLDPNGTIRLSNLDARFYSL